nr:hypothetical protein GCM10010200_072400 [Actinomadura rugatobispora]
MPEETTEIPAEPEAPEEAPPAAEAAEVEQDGDQEGGKANREAARYRTQLRETRTQLEQATGRLAAMQRAEVERLAGQGLARGADLMVYRGEDIAGYLSEDGTVNAEAVQAAVAELVKERAYLSSKPRFQGGADQGPRRSVKAPPSRMGAIFDRKPS